MKDWSNHMRYTRVQANREMEHYRCFSTWVDIYLFKYIFIKSHLPGLVYMLKPIVQNLL